MLGSGFHRNSLEEEESAALKTHKGESTRDVGQVRSSIQPGAGSDGCNRAGDLFRVENMRVGRSGAE